MNRKSKFITRLSAATAIWVAVLSVLARRTEPASTPASGVQGTGQGRISLVDTSSFESSGQGEIRLRANLRDESGKPVQGLSIGRIEVVEEGFPCRIDSLDGPGTQPINVVLVIDTSGSMNEEGRIIAARTAASEAVRQLVPGRDRLGVISFADEFHILVPFGPIDQQASKDAERLVNGLDTPDLLGAIAGLIAAGGTRIAEPALAGVGMFGAKTDGAKLVIVMTDGEDGELERAVERIGQEAHKAGCKIFTIGFGTGVTSYSTTVLRALADKGNGEYYFAPDAETLAKIYRDQVQVASEEFGIRVSSPFPQADGLERRLVLRANTPRNGTLIAESRYRVGSMISAVRAEPIQFGVQNGVGATESPSSTPYPLLLVLGIAGCLTGAYFLTRFLPSGDSGAHFVMTPTVAPTTTQSKSPLPPPPGRTANATGLQDKSELGAGSKAAVPPPAPRKLPPPPGKK